MNNEIRTRNGEPFDFTQGLQVRGIQAKTFVNNIADLKALDITKFTNKIAVEVLGYYTPGDNGGGVFYWDIASDGIDNSGTIIRPASNPLLGRWLRNTTDQINVKWFGARGDGITDDTTAIQKAYFIGKNVYFPETNNYYKISDTIVFYSWQISVGKNINKTRVVMTNKTKFAFYCSPIQNDGISFYIEQANGGGFFDLNICARYGICVGNPNFLNSPTYDYSDFSSFYSASIPVQGFVIERCVIYSDVIHQDAVDYILASPDINSAIIPTTNDLYTRGCGICLSNVYRGKITNSEIKLFGIGVWLFGADLSQVDNCRIANNLRHVHIHAQSSASGGFQTKVYNNDFLSNYRYGGVHVSGAYSTIENNYFENTGNVSQSAINYYISDTAQSTNIKNNRFDDYGNTKTIGPIIVFSGPSGTICTENKVADNRPSGAGNLASISILTNNYNPAFSNGALNNRWGMIQMTGNDNTFPFIIHPMAQYTLDNNPLEWSPTKVHRNMGYYDISGGGLISTYKFAQDAKNFYYLNTAPQQNGIILPLYQNELNGSLNYKITVKSKCLKSVGPFTVFWVIKWISETNVTTDLFASSKTYSGNTQIETLFETVTLPELSQGRFVVFLDSTESNLYSIKITEA